MDYFCYSNRSKRSNNSKCLVLHAVRADGPRYLQSTRARNSRGRRVPSAALLVHALVY